MLLLKFLSQDEPAATAFVHNTKLVFTQNDALMDLFTERNLRGQISAHITGNREEKCLLI